MVCPSLVPHPRSPPGKKQCGERSWAYYPKVVMTNEIVRLVIIMYRFPYNSKICSSPFWAGWPQNIVVRFIVAKGCASARNLTWFTRPFPLVRGWGLGVRLGVSSHLASFQQWNWLWEQSLSILGWSKTISYRTHSNLGPPFLSIRFS